MNAPRRELPTFGPNTALIGQFVRQEVRFIVVGGLAGHFYAAQRTADDLDLLIEPTPENADRLFAALVALHMTAQFSKDVISSPTQRPQQIPLKTIYCREFVICPGL